MADRAKKIASLSADKLRQLMDRLKQQEAGPAERMGRTPWDGGRFSLSFSQERLWILDRLGAGTAAYNIPAAARLSGALDADALGRTFEEVVRRHESLRARFDERDGTPFQEIAPEVAPALPRIDFPGCWRTGARPKRCGGRPRPRSSNPLDSPGLKRQFFRPGTMQGEGSPIP